MKSQTPGFIRELHPDWKGPGEQSIVDRTGRILDESTRAEYEGVKRVVRSAILEEISALRNREQPLEDLRIADEAASEIVNSFDWRAHERAAATNSRDGRIVIVRDAEEYEDLRHLHRVGAPPPKGRAARLRTKGYYFGIGSGQTVRTVEQAREGYNLPREARWLTSFELKRGEDFGVPFLAIADHAASGSWSRVMKSADGRLREAWEHVEFPHQRGGLRQAVLLKGDALYERVLSRRLGMERVVEDRGVLQRKGALRPEAQRWGEAATRHTHPHRESSDDLRTGNAAQSGKVNGNGGVSSDRERRRDRADDR